MLRLQLVSRHDAFLNELRVQSTDDGQHILCHGGDKVNVLSCESGRVLHSLEAKEDQIYALRLSPDGKNLVTSHTSGLLRLWDWENNEVRRTWKSLHMGPIPTLSFDGTSTLVGSGGVDGTIKVWDIVRQYCTHSLKGSTGVISTIQFYQNSKEVFIYGSGDDAVIRCWNLMTSEVVQELQGHFSKITSLNITTSGKQLVSCSRDKVLMLWDLVDGTLIRTVATHESMEGAILIPPGGSVADIGCGYSVYVITGGERGVLRVWNMATSECVFKQEDTTGTASAICQLCYTASSNTLTVLNNEHHILIYDVSSMNLKKQYVGFSDEILDVAFCGESEAHVVVATNSCVIKIYEVSSFDCQLIKGHTDTVLSLSVSQVNKNLFASSSKDNTIRLWHLDGAQKVVCLAIGSGHTASVTSTCWSQLSTSFLVSGAEDKCVKMWDVPTSILTWLKKPTSSIEPAVLHCHHTEIAHDKDINSVALSPNDRLLATASQDKTARLYATNGLALQGVMRGHRRGIWAVTFSPVDQIAATASADCTVRLWSIADFSCVKTFEGHDSSVLRVVFLRRGMQLLTCSADSMLKLWSVHSNECVQTCSEHEAKVWALAVDGEERRFISGGTDSALILWRDVHDEEQAVEAEAAALRASHEQALANLVQQRQWLRALKLAIRLKRPFRCLQILKQVRLEPACEERFSGILTQLRDDQLDDLLLFAIEWNTSSKHCHEAQLVVSLLLRLRGPEAWRRLPSFRTLLEGLLPYTERHFERMGRLLQSITFLDYTAASMKVTSQLGAEPTASAAYQDDDLFSDVKRPSEEPTVKDGLDIEVDATGSDAAEVETAPVASEDSGLEMVETAPMASEDSGLEIEERVEAVGSKSKKRSLVKTGKRGNKRKLRKS